MLFWNKLTEYKEIPEKIPEFPEIWHKSPEIPELSKWLGIAISSDDDTLERCYFGLDMIQDTDAGSVVQFR